MKQDNDRQIPELMVHEGSWVVCQPDGRPIREVFRDEAWVLHTYPAEYYVIKTITQHLADQQKEQRNGVN